MDVADVPAARGDAAAADAARLLANDLIRLLTGSPLHTGRASEVVSIAATE
jgi:hypothetical protein